MLITGTIGNDTLEGTDDADRILGLAGGDVLQGGDGADFVLGGPGEDVLQGGTGADDLRGGGASDNVWGGSGDDTLRGGGGDDILGGRRSVLQAPGEMQSDDTGNDTMLGGPGRDLIGGGTGIDIIDGGTGDDTIYDDDARGTFRGGTGDDVINLRGVGNAALPNATVFGDDGDDRLFADLLFGRAVLDGGNGNDELSASGERLTLRGRAGDDNLRVSSLDPAVNLQGGSAIDPNTQVARLAGGGGDDAITGGRFTNTLLGGSGDDVIFSLGVNDQVTTGAGLDIVAAEFGGSNFGRETFVVDFQRGEDRLYLGRDASFSFYDGSGDGVIGEGDTLVSILSVEFGGQELLSTILFNPASDLPQGGQPLPVNRVVLFGVTGLTSADFLTPPELPPV